MTKSSKPDLTAAEVSHKLSEHPKNSSSPQPLSVENAEFDIKDTADAHACDFTRKTATYAPGQSGGKAVPSSYGEGPLPNLGDPRPKRRSPDEVQWYDKKKVGGYQVSRSISITVREDAVAAADRAKVLGYPLRVAITLAPDIDHLDPIARMLFWDPFFKKLRSHCVWRQNAIRRPFPCFFVAARESKYQTHEGEHLHIHCHAPDDEAERLIRLARGWSINAHAKRIDGVETYRDGKLHSAVGYLLKAAHPGSCGADPTILYKPSGALVGQRVKISKNLTTYDVIAATEAKVQTEARMRQERAEADRRRRWIAANAKRING